MISVLSEPVEPPRETAFNPLPFLFLARGLPPGDLPESFIGSHAAHGTRRVDRPKDYSAPADKKLCGLDVATPVLGPPGAKSVAILFRNTVGHLERESSVYHLLSMFLVIHARNYNRRLQRFQLGLGCFPFG